MAYLLDIATRCNALSCSSRAVVELIDARNESRGKWCRTHGAKKLAERQRFEAEEHSRAVERAALATAVHADSKESAR